MMVFKFTVRGSGAFPLDMLRRDECYPAGEIDVHNMVVDVHGQASDESERSVSLIRRGMMPSPERWASFGGRVTGMHRM